jgi:cytochrome c oxidase subunit III
VSTHPEPATAEHNGFLHHWSSARHQREGAFFGVWLFLVTEILFFGGLFLCYTVYRAHHSEAFHAASATLDLRLGVFNTIVLLGSSLTMALAVREAQRGRSRGTALFLLLTILLGGVFLGVKAVEYSHKFHEHHVPGAGFHFEPEAAGGYAGPDVEMFFNLYFAMTGLHAVHMIIGIGLLAALAVMSLRGKFTPANHNLVEGTGLYWHLVDIIWIYLFPLLYLIGR